MVSLEGNLDTSPYPHRNLLGIEGLSKGDMLSLLKASQNFVEVVDRDLKKVPALRGKTIINLFLEPSTRTRVSFEIAGKILSADTINVGSSESSTTKGETLLDTVGVLEAMNPDIVVIRHKESGAPQFLAKHLKRVAIVNAGDGMHEHPTQALLDCLTIQQHLTAQGRSLSGLRVAIVGDIRHSRVARSNILAHLLLDNEVRLIGPETLVPWDFIGERCYGSSNVKIFRDLAEGIEGADVIIVLRMQLERMDGYFVPNLEEYSRWYCVTEKLVDRYAPKAVILHPGPANRGVEVGTSLLDSGRSLFKSQVHNGVAVRMATLFSVATAKGEA